jgi:PiT family inorganic phosphate transporter
LDGSVLILIGLIALAVLFDFTNGFHDSANAIATVVATHVLRPRIAVAWAAAFNFVAFLVVGTGVANTVAQTVKIGYISSAVIFAALLGAIFWNYLSWYLGLPTSSSHALVGGLVGAGLARGGFSAIQAASVRRTAAFVVISPVAGLLLGGLLMLVLRVVLRRADVAKAERRFRLAQLASSAAVALGHGGNNAQKTMGVIAVLLVSSGHLSAGTGSMPIPLWVVLLSEAAIAVGTMSGGWRVVRTMGTRITQLRPVSGFAAETGAAIALFVSTGFGAPVSTTHTVAGAITGVGAGNRSATVHWAVFGRVAMGWLVTLPVAALTAALAYWGTTGPPEPVNGIVMTIVLAALVVLLILALRHAPSASDVEQDIEGEDEIPLRAGTGSLTGTVRSAVDDSSTDPDRAAKVAKDVGQSL